MRRAVLAGAVAAAALAGAPAASAAPSALGCLRAAGDGTLSALAQGATGSPVSRLFSGSLSGVTALAGPTVDDPFGCADAAGSGDTTAVASVAYVRGGGERILASVRSGGGALPAPVRLATIAPGYVVGPWVAVGPRGDVAVAWDEPDDKGAHIRMARRTPGGAFRPAETVTDLQGDEGFGGGQVAVGIDGAGRTTVVWTQGAAPAPEEDFYGAAVEARVAPATGALGATQTLTPHWDSEYGLALAVAADGHALVSWAGSDGVGVAERAAGAPDFGPVQVMPGTPVADADFAPADPAVAVGPHGEALVGWFQENERAGELAAAWHGAGAAFGSPRSLWSVGARASKPASLRAAQSSGEVGGEAEFIVAPANERPRLPHDAIPTRALIGADGHAVITWTTPIRNDQIPAAYSVSGTLADGFGRARRLSGDCRGVSGLAPFESGGTTLLGWTDNAASLEAPGFEEATGAGRIHVEALDHVPPSVVAALKLTATATKRTQAVYYDDPVEVTASCDRACDLRAWAPGRGLARAATSASLARAGRKRIGLLGTLDRQLAPRRPGPQTVRIRACDPTGATVSETKVVVRTARKPIPPLAHLRGVRARRAGDHTIVTWHTDIVPRRQYFVVRAGNDPNNVFDPGAIAVVTARHSRTYRARVQATSSIVLEVIASDPPNRERRATARVSRP